MALAQRGEATLGGTVFAGPGVGIVISGLLGSAMVAWHWRATNGWLVFGVLAFVLTASVWHIVLEDPVVVSAHPADALVGNGPIHGRAEVGWLTAAYGLAGFGYIITATFLPVIARTALPGSRWLDFFWPLFGLGIIVGALLATRLHLAGDLRRALAVCYFVQAAGVVASLLWPTLGGFAFGSLLLGLPFTAIPFFGMQEARRLRPANAASTMGLLTALYGLGQIVGPLLTAMLLRRTGSPGLGFNLALEGAAATLVVGALMHLWMARRFPKA
jgi:predicted MFS family arabinose efflux permease